MMRRLPIALLLVAGAIAVALGIYLPHAAALFLGLTLVCLVPLGLGVQQPTAAVAASVFASLLVLEIGLALLFPDEPRLTRFSGDRFRQHDIVTDLGDLPGPGVYTTQQVTLEGETIFDATYTIGADGFRVTPAPAETDADADAGRLNLFGGSFAFGHGLEDDETLAFQLGRGLAAEVRNFGINGGGPHEALAILESDRETDGLVNVLLTAPWHAERIACGRPWSGGSPRYRLVEDSLVRDGVCPEEGAEPLHRTLRQSMVFDVAETAYNVLRRESIAAAELDLYVAVIERIAELSRQRGQAFVIAYIGTDSVQGVPVDNALLMRRLEATGATVVDVSLAPSPTALSPDYYLHELDKHPTALANEHRTELLAPVIAPLLTQPATREKASRPDVLSN
jgi:hypothetical protein